MTKGNIAVVGQDLIIEGDVRSSGEVEVWGTVLGSLEAERVVIQHGGMVSGILNAGAADINGHLKGRIRVRHLINIGATGIVEGDVRYGSMALAAGGELAAEVRNIPPELHGDFEIIVRRGRSVRITNADLSAFDPDDTADQLTYSVSGAAHGYVAQARAPQHPVQTFTQAELARGDVCFVHDGASSEATGFDVVVADAKGGTSGEPRRVTVVVREA